jgi:hypothetical protein
VIDERNSLAQQNQELTTRATVSLVDPGREHCRALFRAV